jgi:uncharacterized protein YjiK
MKILHSVLLLGSFFLVSFVHFFQVTLPKMEKIKPERSMNLEIAEPSDLVFDASRNSFFVVSDNGYVGETDLNGKLLRKTEEIGIDFEGITLTDKGLVTVDETPRRFQLMDKNWSVILSKKIQYNGGRNKGFESIAWDSEKRIFLTATEKDPVHLLDLDENFNVTNERRLPFSVRDVSGLTIYDGFLWVLSDEDRTIFKCDLNSLQPLRQFLLPIINPEGLTFDQNGNLYVCSDDRERLYFFPSKSLQ